MMAASIVLPRNVMLPFCCSVGFLKIGYNTKTFEVVPSYDNQSPSLSVR